MKTGLGFGAVSLEAGGSVIVKRLDVASHVTGGDSSAASGTLDGVSRADVVVESLGVASRNESWCHHVPGLKFRDVSKIILD